MMGWSNCDGSMWSQSNVSARSIAPASIGQMNTIRDLYDELGMDPDDILQNMTSIEAHKAINELLIMKKGL